MSAAQDQTPTCPTCGKREQGIRVVTDCGFPGPHPDIEWGGAVAFVEKVRAGEVDPSAPMTEAFGDFPREFLSIRAGLFDGLLVSPEHDAAVAALPLPVDGCACTPHEQSAGGVYTEYLLEYEPACPEHSEHLWDPTQGAWVLRSERDAAVAAKALRAAADDVYASSGEGQWPKPSVIAYLRDRADRIEGDR